MVGDFPYPFPNGWFAVCYRDELAVGDVRPLHFFSRDLVAFRDADGNARVLDAFCPHLGAHLGHGGEVNGRSIRCPFHHWEFDGETGACTAVPYAKRIPQNAQVSPWPTRERNGMVLVWHHAEAKPPEWEVPDIEEATSPEWSDPVRHDWTIRTRVQEIGENGSDSAHFKSVHGTLNVPKSEVDFSGVFRHARHPVRMNTPRGEVEGSIESNAFGMGLSTSRYSGICETLQLMSSTPIDEDTVLHRKSFMQRRVDGENPSGGVAAGIIRNVVKQLNEDVPIWEAKVYRERPMLCDSDGPIAQYRRWCQQFYSDGAG